MSDRCDSCPYRYVDCDICPHNDEGTPQDALCDFVDTGITSMGHPAAEEDEEYGEEDEEEDWDDEDDYCDRCGYHIMDCQCRTDDDDVTAADIAEATGSVELEPVSPSFAVVEPEEKYDDPAWCNRCNKDIAFCICTCESCGKDMAEEMRPGEKLCGTCADKAYE